MSLIQDRGPVAFARGVLGLDLWTGQEEILTALLEHDRVAIRSGHKIGKSTSLAAFALWAVCTHPHARVILTASSTRQVESVLWREIKKLHRNARIKIGGHMHESANGGLKMRTGAEIIGFATTDTERMAGFSGAYVKFLLDEASGIPDPIFEAIEGNMAGGASVGATGNPTRTEGFFFRAFQKGSSWHQIAISSERCAIETASRDRTGLATIAWVMDRKNDWGEDSPRYKVRVLGEFVSIDESRLISRDLVAAAIKRTVPLDGTFSIGVDLARFGDDASIIAVRKGRTIVEIETLRGLDGPDVLLRLVEICKRYSSWGKPAVRFDVSGIGQGAAGFFKQEKHAFQFEEINSSNTPTKDGFVRTRDQMLWNFREWLEQGGCLPDSQQLVEDLSIPTYGVDDRNRLVVESKKIIRRRIGKSTDVLDACALACFDGAVMKRNDLSLLRL